MIKKLGWRRFLRLFWGTFRRKYFPKKGELELGLRPAYFVERDMNAGTGLVLALAFGSVFTFIPTALLLLGLTSPNAVLVSLILIASGMFILAVPIGTAISLMIKMNKVTDEFFDEMSRL